MVKSEHKIQSQPSKPMPCSSSSPPPPSPSPSPNSYKKKFKGVRMRSWGSWVSEIRAPNQKTRIWLGSYSTPEAAARAYDAALLCLKGASASLNFPVDPTSFHIPPDAALSPKSIQRVAAAAAANCVSSNPPRQHPNPPDSLTSSPSPSLTSSSLSNNQIDDGLLLAPNAYYDFPDGASMANSEHWYDFDTLQSPKYVDPMMSSMFFNPPSMAADDQLYEEGDIRLWSFC